MGEQSKQDEGREIVCGPSDEENTTGDELKVVRRTLHVNSWRTKRIFMLFSQQHSYTNQRMAKKMNQKLFYCQNFMGDLFVCEICQWFVFLFPGLKKIRQWLVICVQLYDLITIFFIYKIRLQRKYSLVFTNKYVWNLTVLKDLIAFIHSFQAIIGYLTHRPRASRWGAEQSKLFSYKLEIMDPYTPPYFIASQITQISPSSWMLYISIFIMIYLAWRSLIHKQPFYLYNSIAHIFLNILRSNVWMLHNDDPLIELFELDTNHGYHKRCNI